MAPGAPELATGVAGVSDGGNGRASPWHSLGSAIGGLILAAGTGPDHLGAMAITALF